MDVWCWEEHLDLQEMKQYEAREDNRVKCWNVGHEWEGSACRVYERNPEGKEHFRWLSHRCEDNKKINLKEMQRKVVDSIHLAQDREQWQLCKRGHESSASVKRGGFTIWVVTDLSRGAIWWSRSVARMQYWKFDLLEPGTYCVVNECQMLHKAVPKQILNILSFRQERWEFLYSLSCPKSL